MPFKYNTSLYSEKQREMRGMQHLSLFFQSKLASSILMPLSLYQWFGLLEALLHRQVYTTVPGTR